MVDARFGRAGLAPDGLPCSVQLVAPHHREDRLLAAARLVEESEGTLRPPEECWEGEAWSGRRRTGAPAGVAMARHAKAGREPTRLTTGRAADVRSISSTAVEP
ncbi:hypothetical protein SHO565_16360 [Streptomyces sp. HO565]